MAAVTTSPGLPGNALDTAEVNFADTNTLLMDPNKPRTYHLTPSQEACLKRSFSKFIMASNDANDDMVYTTNGIVHFDPDRHLVFEEPSKVYTMEEIGLHASNGVSPVAVSEPFPLFSEEAVNIMRDEIFSQDVQTKHRFQSDIAAHQLRGYAPKHAKFTYEAWRHPKTLALISKLAGVQLVPVIDYEIGHINISVPGQKSTTNMNETAGEEDGTPVVGWHKDSYPFVCVLMMSDTAGMIGGETAIRTGTGEIKKVRGPTKGCAAILQGRYIEHQALSAFNSQERITMVTSFRPRSPFVKDDTVLNTVRPVSNLSDLYGQVAEYQLENTEDRLHRILKVIRDSNKAGATDVKALKSFLEFEIEALTRLNNEIVDEDKVKKGALADVCEAECVAYSEEVKKPRL